jgi:hypothetical protein
MDASYRAVSSTPVCATSHSNTFHSIPPIQQIAIPGDVSDQENPSLSSYVANKLLSFVYYPFSDKNTESSAPVEVNQGPIDPALVEPYEESTFDEESPPPAGSDDNADDSAALTDVLIQHSKTVISHSQTKKLHCDDTNVFSSASADLPSSIARIVSYQVTS